MEDRKYTKADVVGWALATPVVVAFLSFGWKAFILLDPFERFIQNLNTEVRYDTGLLLMIGSPLFGVLLLLLLISQVGIAVLMNDQRRKLICSAVLFGINYYSNFVFVNGVIWPLLEVQKSI